MNSIWLVFSRIDCIGKQNDSQLQEKKRKKVITVTVVNILGVRDYGKQSL